MFSGESHSFRSSTLPEYSAAEPSLDELRILSRQAIQQLRQADGFVGRSAILNIRSPFRMPRMRLLRCVPGTKQHAPERGIPRRNTGTAIAARCGVPEFGRVAAEHRASFGVLPAATPGRTHAPALSHLLAPLIRRPHEGGASRAILSNV